MATQMPGAARSCPAKYDDCENYVTTLAVAHRPLGHSGRPARFAFASSAAEAKSNLEEALEAKTSPPKRMEVARDWKKQA